MKTLRIVLGIFLLLFLLNACATAPKPAPSPSPEPAPPPSYKNLFVLVPDPASKAGEIVVSNQGGSQVVAKPLHATEVKNANTPPSPPFPLEEREIDRIFGASLTAQPDPPVHYLLYFKIGYADLTEDSERLIPEIFAAIRDRKAVDIGITGHTDRVGSRESNFKLGLDRAERVKSILVSKGVDPSLIEVESHGEDNPLIKTEDGVSEPRNRRVEVIVR
jgi:outer membrane protein OmpA-like peptidoglycan-associated protein